ncbi:MAG TPA: hypothetical protein VGQ46_20170 [Thermoanaerobaculia bacterium]|jgi:hypothetical protein|nr:hypothetical protein [Thermoanaerobaculia bacterium]
MIATRIDANARLALVLLFLSMLQASSAAARSAGPEVRCDELSGAYIGTRDDQPLWVLIERVRVTTTKEGCSFRYTKVEANSIRKGDGTADGNKIDLGKDLHGVIQPASRQKPSVILNQTFNEQPLWRVQKIDKKSSVTTNDPAGLFAAASRLADDAIKALLSVRSKLLESVRWGTECDIPVANCTLNLLDEYAKKVAAAQPKPITRVVQKIEPQDPDPALATELETVRRELAEAREEVQRETEGRKTEARERQRLEAAARTGYFTIMPYDDMVRAGLISRDGLFRGVPRLRDFRLDSFKKIDTEESKELILSYRIHRLELLTPHPPASYQLIPISDGKTLLRVIDREAFWRGRFLVIGVR